MFQRRQSTSRILLFAFILLSRTIPLAAGVPLSVPEDFAIDQARGEVKEIFATEFASKKPDDRLALRVRLLKMTDDAKVTPASRYALFQLANDLAIERGDFKTSMDIVNRLAKVFDVDKDAIKLDSLTRLAGMKLDRPTSMSVGVVAVAIVERSIRDFGYADSKDQIDAVSKIAQGLNDPVFAKLWEDRRKTIDRLTAQEQAAAAAQRTLESAKNDAGANAVAGRWLCFVKGDWNRGLLLLQSGNDKDLAEAASADVAAATPAERLTAADRWWKLAPKLSDEARSAAVMHAVSLYTEAIPGLSSLQQIAAKKCCEPLSYVNQIEGRAVVDLLSRADLARDVKSGPWELVDGVLKVHSFNGAQMRFGSKFPASYDVRIELTRFENQWGLGFDFPQAARRASCGLAGMRDAGGSFSRFDSFVETSDLTGTPPPAVLTTGKHYTSRIEVRPQGWSHYINDTLIEWGPWGDKPNQPDDHRLIINVWWDTATFQAILVTEKS